MVSLDLGYEVAAMAATGEDAIAGARKYKPGLILIAIGLRGMEHDRRRHHKPGTGHPVIFHVGLRQ